MTYPTISVIIPRRANDSAEETIRAILNCDYPQHLLEIIEVIGENPSKQRNIAAAVANGEILYFLDNDSIVTPTLFSRIVKYYADESARLAGVGGPNLTPPADGFLQKTFGYALASPFAHFKMCARYKPTGSMRYAGEKELILCNLSVKKETFLREQGFDESMYPNEENEFINRLVNKEYQFIYDPDAYIYRSRRNRFLGFIRQLSHYGSGRADQILVEGLSWNSLLFFLPLGLLCYVLFLLVLGVAGHFSWWICLPLACYGTIAILSALQFAIQERTLLLVGILPVWYVLMHLSYGIGLFRGFLNAWIPFLHRSAQSSTLVELVVRKKCTSA